MTQDWPSLAQCCQLANCAYRSTIEIPNWLKDYGLVCIQAQEIAETDTRWFWARCSSYDVIAFKGTSSVKDAILDAEISKVQYDGCRIHCGFLKAFQSLGVFHGLARPTVFIGHSLGGALATIAAREWYSPAWPMAARTFGSPRIGDQAFADSYDNRVPDTIRVVHNDDIVPRVPKLGYRHVGGKLRLRDDGSVVTWTGFMDWFTDAEAILKADVDGTAIQDHLLANYQKAVSNYVLKGLSK